MEAEEDRGREEREMYVFRSPSHEWGACLYSYLLAIDAQLKEIRAYSKEYNAHLDALKNGETFKPTLTGKAANKSKKANGKKRKRSGSGSGKKGTSKKRKSDTFEDEDDDMLGSEDDDMDDVESDLNSDDDSDSDKDEEESDDNNDDDSNAGSGSENDGSDPEDEETEETLKKKIADAAAAIKLGRQRLNEIRQEKKNAIDFLAGLMKKQTKVQIEKNSFCSLKRSQVH